VVEIELFMDLVMDMQIGDLGKLVIIDNKNEG
jgi:hypothetical protein